MYEFLIDGEPLAQKRPKFRRNGNFVMTYDPSRKDKNNLIKQINKPKNLISNSISVHCFFYFSRPKSHFNSKGELKANAPEYKTTKPDIDNLIKFVFDALNKNVWRDDAVIYSVWATKKYDTNPRTIIRIFENDK